MGDSSQYTCMICREEFDDDPESIPKAHWNTSNLPVRSSGCSHTMCYSCVQNTMIGKMEYKGRGKQMKWLECSQCRTKRCFNTENPIVDVHFCSILKQYRALKSSQAAAGGAIADPQKNEEPNPSSSNDQKRRRMTSSLASASASASASNKKPKESTAPTDDDGDKKPRSLENHVANASKKEETDDENDDPMVVDLTNRKIKVDSVFKNDTDDESELKTQDTNQARELLKRSSDDDDKKPTSQDEHAANTFNRSSTGKHDEHEVIDLTIDDNEEQPKKKCNATFSVEAATSESGDSAQLTGESGLFTKEAFMKNNLFLLDSFIKTQTKTNEGFGLFIRGGVATPGFDCLETKSVAENIHDMSYEEIRKKLFEDNKEKYWSYARQAAMWMKNAVVGSFVIMRHEYKNCKYLPARLKGDNGKSIGNVYVIGVVTARFQPGSAIERDIANQQIPELYPDDLVEIVETDNGQEEVPFNPQPCSISLVEWKYMGMKNDLKKSTRRYVNSVCQPTVAQICKHRRSSDSEKTGNPADIKEDLWKNAKIRISPEEFPEKPGQIRYLD